MTWHDGVMSDEVQVPGARVGDVADGDDQGARIVRFWQAGRQRLGLGDLAPVMGQDASDAIVPSTWTFADADAAVAAILAGRKRATCAALSDLTALGGEGVPEAGDVAIVLDSHGEPRALVRAEQVRTVRVDEVDEAHAGDELGVPASPAALAAWREHNDAGVSDPATQVLLERFTLVHPSPTA